MSVLGLGMVIFRLKSNNCLLMNFFGWPLGFLFQSGMSSLEIFLSICVVICLSVSVQVFCCPGNDVLHLNRSL